MSYTVFVLNDNIEIPRQRFDECLRAIHALHRAIQPDIQCPGGVTSYLAESIDDKLCAAMAFFKWRPMIGSDGVCGLSLELERVGGQDFIEAIAPYVTAGSTIEYIGEDGVATKYVFDGRTVVCHTGGIHYGNP